MIEPVSLTLELDWPPAHAFAVWAERTSLWWPQDHTVSGEPGVTVTFEPRAGGRIFERTAGGEEHDWGEVVAWEPPQRLVYLWHIGHGRDSATEVEIRFSSLGTGTLVEIEHRGWQRLGAAGVEGRAGNLGGWRGVLPLFGQACIEAR